MSEPAKANEEYVTVYHHTDRESARKIAESGKIKQSTDTKNDAAFGPGTYVTRKSHLEDPKDVARNNYDGTTKYYESKIDKTKATIEVKVRKSELIDCPAKGRDVAKINGDLNLKDKDYKIHVREGDTHKTYMPPKK